ncbi:hypothetical protein AURDEDRAFT_130228 [Auricularia subglabra TFB-10046 SS5]|uniref:Uncharacterized protein n=1 Tax=Auricularia subglabra (strain TFB-10046 / SS5) TaxID=717982 RepID=J0D920_AURST|nr:hypothetical protein AURDEDRAFT_130228 [Auricularia subglabra TFB-10046 SS5]
MPADTGQHPAAQSTTGSRPRAIHRRGATGSQRARQPDLLRLPRYISVVIEPSAGPDELESVREELADARRWPTASSAHSATTTAHETMPLPPPPATADPPAAEAGPMSDSHGIRSGTQPPANPVQASLPENQTPTAHIAASDTIPPAGIPLVEPEPALAALLGMIQSAEQPRAFNTIGRYLDSDSENDDYDSESSKDEDSTVSDNMSVNEGQDVSGGFPPIGHTTPQQLSLRPPAGPSPNLPTHPPAARIDPVESNGQAAASLRRHISPHLPGPSASYVAPVGEPLAMIDVTLMR